jgi:hypothetical protein
VAGAEVQILFPDDEEVVVRVGELDGDGPRVVRRPPQLFCAAVT